MLEMPNYNTGKKRKKIMKYFFLIFFFDGLPHLAIFIFPIFVQIALQLFSI